jgi:hypothetical protein
MLIGLSLSISVNGYFRMVLVDPEESSRLVKLTVENGSLRTDGSTKLL